MGGRPRVAFVLAAIFFLGTLSGLNAGRTLKADTGKVDTNTAVVRGPHNEHDDHDSSDDHEMEVIDYTAGTDPPPPLANVHHGQLRPVKLDLLPGFYGGKWLRDEEDTQHLLDHTYERVMENLGQHFDHALTAVEMQVDKHVRQHIPEIRAFVVNTTHSLQDKYTTVERSLEAIVGVYTGRTWATWVCGVVMALLVGGPFAIVIYFCGNQLGRLFSLNTILLVCNFYGMVFFLFLAMCVSVYGEPMKILHHSYLEGYTMLQLTMAALYIVYVLLHLGLLCTVQLLCTAILRVLSVTSIGVAYYSYIWYPAILDEPPRLNNPGLDYLALSVLFFFNMLLPRVGPLKKTVPLGALQNVVKTEDGLRNTDD
eukprot:jgi/Mesvir1/28783/Mv09260-RA.1